MTTEIKKFDAKDPAEIVPLSFEFAALTDSPGSPVLAMSRHSGTADPSNLTAMLVGSPQVVGTQVRQKITGGVNGTNYRLRCQVDTPDGLRYVLTGDLPVETA